MHGSENLWKTTDAIASLEGLSIPEQNPQKAQRLRIYVGEAAHYQRAPLYHAIVVEARKMGLAGATVCRGIEGFGPSSRIHTLNLLDLSSDLPVVIEIVDSEANIQRFLPTLDRMIAAGIFTVDDVLAHHYVARGKPGPHAPSEHVDK